MSRARQIADFGDGIATADIDDGAVTAAKINSTLDLTGKTVTLPAGVGGKLLNVVKATFTNTVLTTTSSSYVDVTGFNASITPSSATSKILIIVQAALTGSGTTRAKLGLYRGATLLNESGIARVGGVDYYAGLMDLDSPSTTSSTTYQLKFKVTQGTAVMNQSADFNSHITLMEIAP